MLAYWKYNEMSMRFQWHVTWYNDSTLDKQPDTSQRPRRFIVFAYRVYACDMEQNAATEHVDNQTTIFEGTSREGMRVRLNPIACDNGPCDVSDHGCRAALEDRFPRGGMRTALWSR